MKANIYDDIIPLISNYIIKDYENISQEGETDFAVQQIAEGVLPTPARAKNESESLSYTKLVVQPLRTTHPLFFYHSAEKVHQQIQKELKSFFNEKKVTEFTELESLPSKSIYTVRKSFQTLIDGKPYQIDALDLEAISDEKHYDKFVIKKLGSNKQNFEKGEALLSPERTCAIMVNAHEEASQVILVDEEKLIKIKSKPPIPKHNIDLIPAVLISEL